MDEHKFLSKNCRLPAILLLFVTLLIPYRAYAKPPYEYFIDFCDIGERVPGTAGHRRARDFIVNNLHNPELDSFNIQGTNYYNIYKRFDGEQPAIGFAAHWDSDPGCPGANDGGSGVALLLSLADTLMKNRSRRAVDLLFFDGEDVGGAELLGSEHFAARCVRNYNFVIVLDMVGDKDLQLFQEGYSAKFFPELVDSLWEIGSSIAPRVFVPLVKYYIIDDHMSLIKYGIRSVDIIDFDYPYWDTKDDTVDKCSRESLDLMYSFVLKLVYRVSSY
jgi:glutaminyl-peptide cyclotransferase